MSNNLVIGNHYKRADLNKSFNTDRISKSREGILQIGQNITLFCTLEKAQREEQFHYNDYFENDFFRWDSQNPQHINTPMIQKMVNGEVDIFLFCRIVEKIRSKTQPFVYCGKLEFNEHFENTSRPVHLIFESIEFQDNPKPALKEIYEWKPGKDNISPVRKSVANKVSRRRGGGQGYEKDEKVRKAIELYAMKQATMLYENNGYFVEDTSANESFDLLCSKNGFKDRKVEVKGTRGLGNSVILTYNEVKSANDKATLTDLIIVHSVVLEEKENKIIVKDGQVKHFRDWVPLEKDLTPSQFNYRVPGE